MKPKQYRYDFYDHGVTQTLITLWLRCREQCRLQYVEGWRSLRPSFPLEYGSAMHWMLAEMYGHGITKVGTNWVRKTLDQYHEKWIAEHPILTDEMREMHQSVLGMAEVVLPRYIDRCMMLDGHYNDGKKRWISLESNFRIKHVLKGDFGEPTTEQVSTYLNGRFDGVYGVPAKNDNLWLFETKNLSVIDESALQDLLPTDFQVNFYLRALRIWAKTGKIPRTPSGVLYNIIRRPRLYRRKDEALAPYLDRVRKDVADPKRIDFYFMRFKVKIDQPETRAWEESTLLPVLTEMWRWLTGIQNPNAALKLASYVNHQNLITKYGRCEMYDPLVRGNYSGCYKRSVPFSELEDA